MTEPYSAHIGIHRKPYRPDSSNDSPRSTARIQSINSQHSTCGNVIKSIGHIFLAAIGGLTYLFSFGCWSKAKEFTSKHITLAKDLFYPSLKDKILNQNQQGRVESETKGESENQTPSSAAGKPSIDDQLDREEDQLDSLKNKGDEVGGKMEEILKSQAAASQNVSSTSSKQPTLVIDKNTIESHLVDMFNAALDQMEAEEDKSFNYETRTAGPSIKGKFYSPKNLNHTDIEGSFCINPAIKNATIPISGRMKFTMINGQEQRFNLCGLLSNHLENLTTEDLFLQQKELIGKRISAYLKARNPTELSDLGIYKALENTLDYLQKISEQNGSNFSATLAITLNEKLWIAHAGSSAAFLSNQGNPFQLSLNQFSIIAYPLNEIRPYSKLILVSGDIKEVASGQQIVKGEYKANQGFSGANNGSAARQIACAAHAAGSGQDIAVLVIKLPEIQAQKAPQKAEESLKNH